MNFVQVPEDDIVLVKHWLSPAIDAALSRTGADAYMSKDYILEKCQAGEWQAWVNLGAEGINAVVITHIALHPSGYKSLQIDAVGGTDINSWFDEAVQTLISFAKANGCSELSAEGRPGWKKLFQSLQVSELRQSPHFIARF